MRSESLNRFEASELLDVLLDDATSEAQIAAILIALKRKGETVEELAGLAEGMRARAVRISSRHKCFLDTAGTGSSSVKTFNVSTAAAFVIAGAGLPVAKHGNRAASSNCGSADVLTALGVNVSVDVSVSEACLNDFGICFMFAPLYHSATARVAGVRRQLGVHTTFNLLGPLTNPAGAPRQVIGVWDRALAEPLARATKRPERSALGNGLAPHAGFPPLSVGSIQIWKIRVVSGSRLYSAWRTPLPALITCTSPASVRPLLPRLSSWVMAPSRT